MFKFNRQPTICKDTLFHGKALLIIAAGDADHIATPFVSQRIGLHLGAHALFIENSELVFIRNFKELLAARCRIRHVKL